MLERTGWLGPPGRSVVVLVVLAVAYGACDRPQAASDAETADTVEAVAAAGVVAEEEIPADIDRVSWARLPLPERAALDAEGQRVFDEIVRPGSRYADGLRGPVAMWMYSPPMAEAMFGAGTQLRYGTARDQRQTELAILSTAREIRSQYEWTAHQPLALAAGLEPEIVELVKERGDLDVELPGLGEQERTIIQLAREICSEEKVSSSTYSVALDLFGERGVMELAGLIGYYNFVNATLKTFDLQVAVGRQRLLPDLWE